MHPKPHEQDAEQVRRHLVTLRGGAPFLSPLDGRLLLRWLDGGVPVAVILVALETAAARRRARKVRTPLTLEAARGEVARRMGQPEATTARPTAGDPSLQRLVALLRAADGPWELEAARRLQAVQGDRLRGALRVVAEVLEAAWDSGDRGALEARAREELEELREGMEERRWLAAVDQLAHELLRQRHPLLSAAAVLDAVGEVKGAAGATP